MLLTVNGQEKNVADDLNLLGLLNELKLDTGRKGLALCVNMQVIPRQTWENTHLNNGDRIEIVIAAPGG
jgi:sulfur carrier protein